MKKKRCVLCGWESDEYLFFPVPLSSPKQEQIICLDCAEEVSDMFAERIIGTAALEKAEAEEGR